jgi:hypothetical protein
MARIAVTARLFADLVEKMESSGHVVRVRDGGAPMSREELIALPTRRP